MTETNGTEPTDPNQLAYSGSNYPPKRDLTARERDILARLLHSLVYPFQVEGTGWDGEREAKEREAIRKYTRAFRAEDDIKVVHNILLAIDPRMSDEEYSILTAEGGE